MIRILYFASLRERLGRAEETLQDFPGTLAGLRVQLAARGDVWGERWPPMCKSLADSRAWDCRHPPGKRGLAVFEIGSARLVGPQTMPWCSRDLEAE